MPVRRARLATAPALASFAEPAAPPAQAAGAEAILITKGSPAWEILDEIAAATMDVRATSALYARAEAARAPDVEKWQTSYRRACERLMNAGLVIGNQWQISVEEFKRANGNSNR